MACTATAYAENKNGGMTVNQEITGAHEITMTNRSQIVVSGVSDVDCFNEEMIVLTTNSGALTIAGEGLHIGHLNLQEGQARVEGRVRSLEYDDRAAVAKGGLLRRIFR